MLALWAIAAICQVALAVLLLAAVVHLGRSAAAAWGWQVASGPAPPVPAPAPTVTVQLPLHNERAVAERVIRAAAALDWPRDRLEIQALDDSDDETSAIVDRVASELLAAGHAVEVLRRPERAGYKAGNLANGLRSARGDCVLVLDADSRPAPDLVRRLIGPLVAEPDVAFSQGRWAFDNEGASLLTRAQAVILDGLMLVEQPLLSRRRLPLQFNGTAGMWRRSALEGAGGWLASGAASVAEDLDVSLRARLAGYRGVSLPEAVVATELPSTMAAFRAQQRRWVRGAGEVLRELARRLLRQAVPASERLVMLAHLARHARQPLLVAATVWLPLSAAGVLRLPLDGPVWRALVAALLLAVGAYYAAARRRCGRSPAAGFAMAPVVVALAMGMAPCLTTAFVGGLLGRGRAGFERTPKGGAYRSRVDPLAAIEVAAGAVTLAAAVRALAAGEVVGGLALAVLVAAGYLWVGIGSLVDR